MDNILEQLKFSFIYELVSPLVQRFELAKWILRGRVTPTPHLLKQKMVKYYAKQSGLRTFVETGTYLGVMINAVKNDFDKIFTIELDGKLYRRAKKKFKGEKKIKIVHGDSAEVLPKVIKKLDTPSLFWLDAHFSEGITARGDKDTPIVEEIRIILKHNKKDLMLIDDADSFNGKNEAPSINNIKRLIHASPSQYLIKTENNILVVFPKNI